MVPYDAVSDAVRIANGTRYGFGPRVWSADLARARGVAQRIESGMVDQ